MKLYEIIEYEIIEYETLNMILFCKALYEILNMKLYEKTFKIRSRKTLTIIVSCLSHYALYQNITE